VVRVAAASLAILTFCAAAQDDAATRQLAETCAACHGPDGNSTNPAYPILAGQSWRYIYIELKDFNEGRRKDPQMSPMAANLTREQMMALGNWFAAKKPKSIGFKADPAKVAAGRKINDAVLCPMCHLGEFVGQNEIPRVAGQWPQYVKKQLEDFRAKRRTNDGGNMTAVSAKLSDDDIENLSQYIANLY
jgi:cytochrome c553